jgi:hypothetical protein
VNFPVISHISNNLCIQFSLFRLSNAGLCELIQREESDCVDLGDFNIQILIILQKANQKLMRSRGDKSECHTMRTTSFSEAGQRDSKALTT